MPRERGKEGEGEWRISEVAYETVIERHDQGTDLSELFVAQV